MGKVKTTCDMKTNCIRDSDLQRIAADPLGFSGLTEALMGSNRTLNDVLSSLREVSMASVSMSADSKLFENSIEYQCALVRQIDNRVKDSMTRATDMMHFFHGEMSRNLAIAISFSAGFPYPLYLCVYGVCNASIRY